MIFIKLSYLLVKLTNFYMQVDLFYIFYHHPSSNYNTFYWNDELREFTSCTFELEHTKSIYKSFFHK